jgi:hypothetical protein
MVIALADPAFPIEFLILFFYNAIANEGYLGLLKTGFLTSLIVFPFIWFAKMYVIQKVRGSPVLKLFWTSVIMSLIAVIIIRVWYLIGGSVLIPDFVALIGGFVVLSVGTFVFTVVGDWLNRKLVKSVRYDWISIFIVDFAICTLLWGMAWMNILISL